MKKSTHNSKAWLSVLKVYIIYLIVTVGIKLFGNENECAQ